MFEEYHAFQIHHEKLEFKVASRIGSLANVKHRPGGGDKKIFDDKEYIRLKYLLILITKPT